MESFIRITGILLLAMFRSAVSQSPAPEISPEPATFFPEIKGNLTKIVWAHAVNSKADLKKALAADNVMMLEADVVLGNISGNNETVNIPIMAHPPENESDLSLDEFLKTISQKSNKGIKLDFKSIGAFNASRQILESYNATLKVPLFLNADILSGPVKATTDPVDPKMFLDGVAQSFAVATRSVGWTTRYGSEFNITKGQYSAEDIRKMIDTLTAQKLNNKPPVTFAVRAGLVANDIEVIKTLMQNSSSIAKTTLTIWSSQGDEVDTKKLSELIKAVGVDKVYVDVPKDVWDKLELSNTSGAASTTLATIGVMLIALLFPRML